MSPSEQTALDNFDCLIKKEEIAVDEYIDAIKKIREFNRMNLSNKRLSYKGKIIPIDSDWHTLGLSNQSLLDDLIK